MFSVYVVLFGACLTYLIGLSFVWRVFGFRLAFFWYSLRYSFLGKFLSWSVARYSFLGKFLSWSVAFVCNGLQSISSDCVFAVLFVVFFIVLVSTLFVFSRPV